MEETWVPSLGWEDSPEKGMAAHSSILAWRIPWAEEPGELQSVVLQRDTTEQLTHTHVSNIAWDILMLKKCVFNLKFKFNEASDVLLHNSRSWWRASLVAQW